MWKITLRKIMIVLFFCIAHSPVYAGSQQSVGAASYPIAELAPFAKRVEQYAGQQGARVFIIARLGSPRSLLPEGISFTHAALAIYSDIKTAEGKMVKGYAIYNLYQDAEQPDVSKLVVDYPVDFFSGVEELVAGVIVPTPKLQEKILRSMVMGRNEQFHNPDYSLVSNPFSTRFQNCTEHLLDILFSSIYDTDSLSQIKVNQKAYFQAQTIALSPVKRLLAPMLSSAISLSDHEGDIKLVTFTKIAHFLMSHGLAKNYAVVDVDGVTEFQ